MHNKEKDGHQPKDLFQLGPSQNKPQSPKVSNGMFITKVPVLLLETTIQIDLDGMTEFPEPVLEIKQVKNVVKLLDTTLLLPSNKLFIKGYVRKNVDYATPAANIEPSTASTIAAEIHSFTTDLPFKTVTNINEDDYVNLPMMPKRNLSDQFTYRVNEPVQSTSLSQLQHENQVFYNELPYCELISSKVIDWNDATDRRPFPEKKAPVGEGRFMKIEEKMVVEFTVQILQKQQIRVPSTN